MVIGIMFKTNELQERVKRCLFGALKAGERYQTFENEMEQFAVAMRALGVKTDDGESWFRRQADRWITPVLVGSFATSSIAR